MAACFPACNSLSMATHMRLLRSPPLSNPNNSRLPRLPTPALAILLPSHPIKPFPSGSSWSPYRKPFQLAAFSVENGDRKPSEERKPSVSSGVGEAAEARGQSTLPERFRHLTKEAPDRPMRWPWLVALFFAVYAWRTVLWELTNWTKAARAILHFIGYLLKLALAFIFHFIGDPITGLIRCIEFSLYYVRYIYASIVAFAPVPELTRIILFSSTVLAIAETTVPNAVTSQPYLLTMAGIISFVAVKGFILELTFWLLIACLFCYSCFIKKKDGVSAALPSAAVLAAVGEPWVRGLAIGSFLALAISQRSRSSEGSAETEIPVNVRKLPVPLLLVGLAIGVHVAAKWVRHRHLTWMIV